MRFAGFEAGEDERQQGINIINAAIKADVQHFIWSYVSFGSMSVDSDITSLTEQRIITNTRFRTSRQSQLLHSLPMAVFVSETSLQSRRSRLSSDNTTELYIDIPIILLLGAYVSLCLVARCNLITDTQSLSIMVRYQLQAQFSTLMRL